MLVQIGRPGCQHESFREPTSQCYAEAESCSMSNMRAWRVRGATQTNVRNAITNVPLGVTCSLRTHLEHSHAAAELSQPLLQLLPARFQPMTGDEMQGRVTTCKAGCHNARPSSTEAAAGIPSTRPNEQATDGAHSPPGLRSFNRQVLAAK